MRYKVTKKQKNSKYCAVCGIENPFGFEARFYETESNEVVAIFQTKFLQQSYPSRVHGGIISAMLDEIIGRALWIDDPDGLAVTVELSLRYKKPIPLDETLKCVGRITRNTRKIFEGTGEIYLPDGSVAVEAKGKYWKMTSKEIEGDETLEADMDVWVMLDSEEDPEYIEI